MATPLGNLEDMTHRGARILREVDYIACEDTRHARRLLDHYGIAKPLLSYHEYNEAARAADLIEKIEQGSSVALITDAGTPLISDPGYRVVKAAVDAGVTVVPVPGASAAIAALSASGLPTDVFRFCGFLPPRQGARRKALEQWKSETATLIFYEGPHRILETLEDMEGVLGNRPVVVAREMTKLHEEFLRGSISEVHATLAARPSVKGEITILIGKGIAPEGEAGAGPIGDKSIGDAVRALEATGIARMDAIKQVARERGLSKRDCYRRFEEGD